MKPHRIVIYQHEGLIIESKTIGIVTDIKISKLNGDIIKVGEQLSIPSAPGYFKTKIKQL